MTFIKLLLQSLLLFVLFAVVLLSPLVTGGHSGEKYGILISGFLLIAVLSYILLHRSSYAKPGEESVETLQTRASRLKSTSLAVTVVSLGLQVLAGAMLALFFVVFIKSLAWSPPRNAGIADQIFLGFGRSLAIGMLGIAAVLSYLSLFFIPFFVSLPIAASISRQWKNPGRFLLLRPFNRRYATRPLRTVVRKLVAYYGHTYTLADTSIKVPWHIRIPVIVGQLGFLQFRMRTIKKDKDLDRLNRVMENRWMRNLNWCMSWGRVFAVATIDKFWKACVSQMIPHADVIFIDLTELRDNILWEVEQCKQLEAADRIIFLVQDGIYSEAKRYLAGHFDGGVGPSRLFRYSERGTLVDTDFQSAIACLLANR